MGNYRFRLSDMMPNSWFYKLRDMGRATRGRTIQHPSKRILHHPKKTTKVSKSSSLNPFPQPSQDYLPNRPSYYFPSREQIVKPTNSPAHPKVSDTHFPIDQPRKSERKNRKKPINPSPNPLSSVSKSDHRDNSSFSASSYGVTSSATDIIIDMKSQNLAKDFDDTLSAHRLPPILTKPAKKEAERAELDSKHIMLRRAQQGLQRIKVRPRSPKIEVKSVQINRNRKATNSKRLAESFVMVKKSADPRRDFRESMVEMIVENDIRASKDLEELLACYLSLNSDEYHDLIVKVFEEIWVDLTEVREIVVK